VPTERLLSLDELREILTDPTPSSVPDLLAVDVRGAAPDDVESLVPGLLRVPSVRVAVGAGTEPVPADAFDVLLTGQVGAEATNGTSWVAAGPGGLEEVAAAVERTPRAALTLVRLLRLTTALDVDDGLVAESLAYSMLLAGPEFDAWLAERGPVSVPPTGDQPVLVTRHGDELRVILNRPRRHNAYAAAVRDALVDALGVAVADPGCRVVLAGAGPSFCSGGDLGEFGTTPDVATAHLVRTSRSAGSLLALLGDRVTVQVHGACIGAGTELSAFGHRVVARPGTYFQLPELAMGLVPGAGGTVSIPRRIGRHRTAWLALTGRRLDVGGALTWGLVDDIVDR
jgi:hypothetical protein